MTTSRGPVDDWNDDDILNAQNVELAGMLAAGRSQAECAERAGVSQSTITRRLREPAFRRLIARFREVAYQEVAGTLARALPDAVAQLHRVCTDGETEGLRLRAAEAILTLGFKVRESMDLAERISRLEEDASE